MQSKKYDKVRDYYIKGLWNTQMVQNAVGKWITQKEANKIIAEKTSENS